MCFANKIITEKEASIGYKFAAADRMITDNVAVCLHDNKPYGVKLRTDILYYRCDVACPRTNICTKRYTCEFYKIIRAVVLR